MRLEFILVGPPGAGKTELGLRMLGVDGTSGGSTVFFNVFSHTIGNFLIDEDIDEGNLYINRKEVTASVYDIAGQLSSDKKEFIQIVSPFLEKFKGIIYFIDSEKPDIEYIKLMNEQLNEEYTKIGLKKPLTVIYVSKSLTKDSKLKTQEVIEGVYESELIKSIITISEDTNSALFIGDSIGKKPINPKIYMIRTFDKLLDIPIETDVYSPVSATVILPRLKTKRGKRALEKALTDKLTEYGVC